MHTIFTILSAHADVFSNIFFLLMGLSTIYYIVVTFVFEVIAFFYSFNERQKRIVNSDNNSNDLDSIISFSNFSAILTFIYIII